MARHPNRQRRLKPKHRRTHTPAPRGFEYNELRERRIKVARRCLVALTLALLALGVVMCVFR